MSVKEKVNEMILNEFIKYSDWTVSTSIHKNREAAITCTLLGLVGEAYEYNEKIATGLELNSVLDIQMELGDILYYLGHFVYRIGARDKIHIKELADVEQSFLMEGIHGPIALLCEAFKKVIRDFDYEVVGSSKEEEVYDLVSTILTMLIDQHDTSDDMDFLETLSLNQDKLTSRKDRNVIKGDGDNR